MAQIKHTAEIDFNGQKALQTALCEELKSDKRIKAAECVTGRDKRGALTILVFFTKYSKKMYNQFGTEYNSAGFRTELAGNCCMVSIGAKPYVSAW